MFGYYKLNGGWWKAVLNQDVPVIFDKPQEI
jgi:hypothetical protein